VAVLTSQHLRKIMSQELWEKQAASRVHKPEPKKAEKKAPAKKAPAKKK